jgi:hypothetical protein
MNRTIRMMFAVCVALGAQACTPADNTSTVVGTGGRAGGSGGAQGGGTGGTQGGGTGGSTVSGSGGTTVSGSGGQSAGTGGAAAGTGGAGTGGASAGTGGASAGTGGASAGTGGASAGTGGRAAGTGGGAAGGASGTVCGMGVRNNAACTTGCTGNICGLADLGLRDCPCNASMVYQCAGCTFTITPDTMNVLSPPATPLPVCTADIMDELPCTTKGDRCTCMTGVSTGCLEGVTSTSPQACACWLAGDTAGTFIWDCDRQPWR